MISRIGKYAIETELGRGGFGRVYRGLDPDLRRPVAIKVLTESDPELLRRFQLEIDTTASLHHKNIVVLYERGEEAGVPYVVMELLEGQTLEQVIRTKVPLTLIEKIRIMTQMAQGLAYAHSRGIIHRDVKPGNVMLLPDGNVKIMDFGIARMMNRNTMNLTREGLLVGTVPYMAPEQFEPGGRADQQTDIFAYGDIYYELLAGRHPFSLEQDIYATITRIRAIEPEAISQVVPECPEALEWVIHRAIAKDREVRYQTLNELLLDSEAVMVDLQHERAIKILAEVPPLIEAGDLEAADLKLAEVAEIEPGNREARQLRKNVREEIQRRAVGSRVATLLGDSETQIKSRQFAEAVQTLESALRLNRNDEVVKARLAEANAKMQSHLQANRLVAEARRDQQRGNFGEALTRLKTALSFDPENTDANLLFPRVEAETLRREAEARRVEAEKKAQETIQAAADLLDKGKHQDALDLLEGLPEGQRGSAEELEVRARIAIEREEEDRRIRAAEFDAAQTAVRQALAARDLTRAEDLLSSASDRFRDEPGATEAIGRLRNQLEAQTRGQAIYSYTHRSQELLRQKAYREALELLDEGCERFPDESGLTRLRESAQALHEASKRKESVDAVLKQARSFRNAGNPQEALSIVRRGLERIGEDTALKNAIRQLEAEIEQQRYEAGLREHLQRVRGLVGRAEYEEAVRSLESAKEFRNAPEVVSLLDSSRAALATQQEQRLVQTTLDTVRQLQQDEQWTQALGALEDARREYPDNPALAEAAERIHKSIAAEERRARLGELKKNIERAIDSRDWQEAESSLKLAKQEFPREPLVEEANARIQAHYQAERLVAEAGRDHRKSNLPDALKKLNKALHLDPNNAGATELLHRVEDDKRRKEAEQRIELALAEADQLLGARQYVAALEALDKLDEEQRQSPLVATSRERITHARDEEERRIRAAEFNAAQSAVREALTDHELTKAGTLLKSAAAEFGDEPGAVQAISKLRDQLESQTRSQAIFSFGHRARMLIAQRSYGPALDLLEEALGRFPDEKNLAELRDSAISLREGQERADAVAAVIKDATAHRAAGELQDALLTVQIGLEQIGQDPALASLASELERDLERRRYSEDLAQFLDRIRELLASRAYDEAVRDIESQTAYAAEPDVAKLLASAKAGLAVQQEEQLISAALAEAKELEEQQDWTGAARSIDEARRQYPSNRALAEAAERIGGRMAAEERRARLDSHIQTIEQAIAREAWEDADAAIHHAESEFPNEPLLEPHAQQVRLALYELHLSELMADVNASLAAGNVSHAAGRIAATRERFSIDARWRSLEEEVTRRANYESALDHARRERSAGQFAKAEERLERLIREGALDERASQLLDEIVESRLSKQVEEAERAIGRGKFDAAIKALDAARAGAPPKWIARIDELSERAVVQQRERAERERAERQSEIEKITASIQAYIDRDELKQAGVDLIAAQSQFPEASVWPGLRSKIDTRVEALKWLDNSLKQAKKLLPRDPGAAVALLEKACERFPDRAEPRARLTEARLALAAPSRAPEPPAPPVAIVEPPPAEPFAPPARRIGKLTWAAIGVGAVAVIVTLVMVLRPSPKPPPSDAPVSTPTSPSGKPNASGPPEGASETRGTEVRPTGAKVLEGSIVIETGEPSAEVTLDGARVGQTDGRGALTIRRPAGRHSLGITKPGFENLQQDIEIEPDQTSRVRVPLRRAQASVTQPSTTQPGPGTQPASSTPSQPQPVTKPPEPAPQPSTPTQPVTRPPESQPKTETPVARPPATQPSTPTTPPVVRPNEDVQAVQTVIAQFAAAFVQKDFATVSRLWPSIPNAKEFRDMFREREYNVARYSLEIVSPPVVTGTSAMVNVRRTVQTVYRKRPSTIGPASVTVRLQKNGAQWVIVGIQ